MSKLLKKSLEIIHQYFKTLWIALILVLLCLVLYIDKIITLENIRYDLSQVANRLTKNLDGFIEDIFQDIYTLPIYGKSVTNCKSDLHHHLTHIILNNPNLSGISISDSTNKLICSTLSNTLSPSPNYLTLHARSLLGPFRLQEFEQPVYLLQQKMGDYVIGIFVVAPILQRTMQTAPQRASSIALYDVLRKTYIIEIEHNDLTGKWLINHDLKAGLDTNSEGLFAVDKLQSIDGINVIVYENQETTLTRLWLSEALIFVIFLILAYFMFFLLKNIISRRFSLAGTMKIALKNKEFYPVYQPLFDGNRNNFSGVEVLLRWQDSDNQIIMPDLFVAEAEINGLIVPITLQIIEITLKETQSILKNYNYFHLGFNLSAIHFKDPSFFEQVTLLMEHYCVPPSQIIFEITERELFDINNPVFISKMKELRRSGFSLAVDDYGTGHASISYLQSFPFNFLKIDKIFVQAIGTKAITESLNDAIIQMAKGLNLNIIAEGVETEEQVHYLSKNGVQFLQGWYFSKDLTIEQLIEFLKGEKQ